MAVTGVVLKVLTVLRCYRVLVLVVLWVRRVQWTWCSPVLIAGTFSQHLSTS